MDQPHPDPATPNNPPTGNLLLSSLAEYWSVLEPLLLAVAPKTVCEIGIGGAEFTDVLLKFCAQTACRYSGIDPAIDPALIQRLKIPNAEFFRNTSLSTLRELPPQDVYFVDGDHNYFTVLNELRLILRHPQHWPLIFLHDIGWPWGRRDQYCSPDSVPQEFRHPFSTTLGVVPGRNELGPDGFSGDASAYAYGAADHEGGRRNGVLTAIEDFLAEHGSGEWKLLRLPGVFGLGILYAPGKCPAQVAAQLVRIESAAATLGPFLESLERNRLDLFLTYLRQVKDLKTIHDKYGDLQGAYDSLSGQYDGLLQQFETLHQRYADLTKHSDALLASYQALDKHAKDLLAAYDALAASQQPKADG